MKLAFRPMHTIFFWCQKISRFSGNLFLKIKPKMQKVIGKMREIRQNAGNPHHCGTVDTYELNKYLGAIHVLRNTVRGGRVSGFPEKSIT